MKAVILTAGEGTRMRPLTYTRPKAMLPIANKPILEHLLIEAREAGVSEFVFIVGYHEEQVRGYFGDGEKWGVVIEYRAQRTQLGTADALRMAENLVDGDFLVINGDTIVRREDIARLLSEYILLNDVVVDRSTGLYSKTYFKLRYEEHKKLFLNKQINFAVILISVFSGNKNLMLDDNNILIREISSRIMESLSTNDILCRSDNLLSILMPDADKLKALSTAEKIRASLNEMEIRVEKSQYTVHPFIGYASTEHIDDGEDLLDISAKSLEYAMTKSGSNMQSIKAKSVFPKSS